MAAVDKIYGNKKQALEMQKFLTDTEDKQMTDIGEILPRNQYNNDYSGTHDTQEYPLFNLSWLGDMWLMFNCPFKWVIDQIASNYGADIKYPNWKETVSNDILKNYREELGDITLRYKTESDTLIRKIKILSAIKRKIL